MAWKKHPQGFLGKCIIADHDQLVGLIFWRMWFSHQTLPAMLLVTLRVLHWVFSWSLKIHLISRRRALLTEKWSEKSRVSTSKCISISHGTVSISTCCMYLSINLYIGIPSFGLFTKNTRLRLQQQHLIWWGKLRNDCHHHIDNLGKCNDQTRGKHGRQLLISCEPGPLPTLGYRYLSPNPNYGTKPVWKYNRIFGESL